MTHLSPDPLPNHAWRPDGRRRTAEEPTLPAHRPSRLPGQAAVTPEQPEQSAPPVPAGLGRFNALPADEAERALLTCCGSRRWARRVAAHRPYPDLEALLAAADEAAYDLTPGDVAEALACESLTLLPDGAYSAAHMALSAAHAAYESRFGHVFVICLDDTPPEDSPDLVLTAISSRLSNDPDEERIHTAEELRRLVRGRLARRAGAADCDAVPCPSQARP
ncbi:MULTISPECIES: 2-oxo-4-hydroxy-4-carboxy-5-ureidoimidazoline decarboxylase [Streptomyces]|uniref:2-oxo-4-hydroxy-4-carboxy-5-ureidoimidazoline decarboxylase n=1 Tax=Streptomyces apricus TaxID=1828112 RepID=A0A5B0B080_9ACTN|nr:2-oxo-4-hydroxy-4-carboxy-5-ureidoimidazoline decarboxylase [Streptomyces apricus]KAA0935454.1 2-oxo-4-hydroxy-4-carboxy-5-ureidoimidazoline decarboxylase [Streptomyces apricus]